MWGCKGYCGITYEGDGVRHGSTGERVRKTIWVGLHRQDRHGVALAMCFVRKCEDLAILIMVASTPVLPQCKEQTIPYPFSAHQAAVSTQNRGLSSSSSFPTSSGDVFGVSQGFKAPPRKLRSSSPAWSLPALPSTSPAPLPSLLFLLATGTCSSK